MHSALRIFIIAVAASFLGCSELDRHHDRTGRSSDEAHRPTDWQTEMEYKLFYAKAQGGVEFHKVAAGSFKTEQSLEQFVDQLFALAFSGDAQVYLPTVLGEPDYDHPVSPERLVNKLNRFDTILTEDINTGELVETQIDQSFSKSRASALVVHSNVSKVGDALVFEPYLLMLGEQTFEAESGAFRGITPRFFLGLDQSVASDARENFYFLTDSVGVFHLDHLGVYAAKSGAQSFGRIAFVDNPDSAELLLKQRWEFDSKRPAIVITTEREAEQPEL